MKLETSSFYDGINKNIKQGKSFTLTGLTTFSRLLLLKYIRNLSGKKILFITSTEQSALRYSADLDRLLNLKRLQFRIKIFLLMKLYRKIFTIIRNRFLFLLENLKSLLLRLKLCWRSFLTNHFLIKILFL